jgi:Gram-negative porin
MNKRLSAAIAAGLLLSRAGPLLAIENVDVNGFFTVGATRSDSSSIESENGNISDEIGFEQDTRIGLQVYADINPAMSVTAQILGDNRQGGSFDAEFDWAFVSYAFNDNASLRGGKIKLPTFLISDYYEVGYAYPWIRPPAEVYSGNPINAISGVDALLRANLFGSADILVQPYFGVSKGDEALLPQEVVTAAPPNGLGAPAGTVVYAEFEAENMVGVNVALSGDAFTIRAGYLQTEVSAPDLGVTESEDVTFASVGATMDWHNVIGYTEYFERDIEGLANAAFPNQKGWYATLGYRFDRFLPHVTYAQLRDDSSSGDLATGVEQDSLTLGVRYELAPGAALKLEAQRVEPESGSRGLFMAPTDDINIYSLAVDVIF